MDASQYDSASTVAAFMVAFMSAFGLRYMLAALDVGSLYGFGMLGSVSIRQRWIALMAANASMAVALLGVYGFFGITPRDLWGAASICWSLDFVGKAVAIINWIVLVSPILTILAVALIRRAQRRVRRRQMV